MPVTRSAAAARAKALAATAQPQQPATLLLRNTSSISNEDPNDDDDDVSMEDAYESDYDYAYSEDDEADEHESSHSHHPNSNEHDDDIRHDKHSSSYRSNSDTRIMNTSMDINPNAPRDRSSSFGIRIDHSDNGKSSHSDVITTNTQNPANKASGVQLLDSSELLPVLRSKLKEVTDVLQISESASFVLLRCHRWNKERLFELFYMDDEKEREKLLEKSGVLQRIQWYQQLGGSTAINVNHNKRSSSQSRSSCSSCQICCEDDIPPNQMYAMPCGHAFCIECWTQFLQHMVMSGPSDAIHTKCPQAGCQELVTEDELEDILLFRSHDDDNNINDSTTATATGDSVSDVVGPISGTSCTTSNHASLLDKFRGYQLRCFVEQNGRTRWCPGNNCSKVAYTRTSAHMDVPTSAGPVVSCDCGTRFCLKCAEEPHAPTHCALLQQWKEKCKNESETANWILANTKACPKCSSRIEKNQGCNHMTCQSCKYEFCWICMGDWVEHGANTGGYYKCNKFDDSNNSNFAGQSDADKAKRELDRYLHYYKRYHAHAEAQKFATRQLADTEAKMVLLQEASDNNTTWIDVQFLKTATEQLIECRRVLKYTYTYAYYMHAPPDSNVAISTQRRRSSGNSTTLNAAAVIIGQGSTNQGQKERFENHQEMLERFTENLSELSEKPLAEMDRADVINQTRVVDRFMKNVLKYVEDGLEE